MDLSIIIVNYKSSRLILDCIRTIVAETHAISYEVIVVDNDSHDDSATAIPAAYPFVKYLQAGYNSGFARANNMGLRLATGDHLLLLNPDTLILNGALDKAVPRFSASTFVACGVQQLNGDGTPQISGNYFMKGGLNHLLPLPYWGSLIRWVGYRLKTKVPNVASASTEEIVDWISGAFLMVKRGAIEQAGLMDEDFFLYAEEVEWCSRLRKIGQLVIFGDLNIVHLQGETTSDAFGSNEKGYYGLYDRMGLQLMVSNHLRVRKQFGVMWFLILLLNYTFAIPVFFIGTILEGIFRLKNPFRYMRQVRGLTVNVFKLWGLAPTIIRNKPHFYKLL
jgi:GT2 family glycosyltransferase